jgi:hypothetical protein
MLGGLDFYPGLLARRAVGLGSRTRLSRATSRFSAYDGDAKERESFCDSYFF